MGVKNHAETASLQVGRGNLRFGRLDGGVAGRYETGYPVGFSTVKGQ